MKEQLKAIEARAKEELSKAVDLKALDDIRVRFLGKKGEITGILKQMGKLSAEERPVIGQLANSVRADIEEAIAGAQNKLKSLAAAKKLEAERIDVTLPGNAPRLGKAHPLNATLAEVEEVFLGMGFDIVDMTLSAPPEPKDPHEIKTFLPINQKQHLIVITLLIINLPIY